MTTQTLKITQLASAGVLSGTEVVPVVQGGTTKQVTTQQIADLFTGAGSGTVTSVGLSAPSFLSVAGTPVTSSGTLALSLATQSANQVFVGPATGPASAPTFRALVAADIPNGLPAGGTTGQVLAKTSGTDYATGWISAPTGSVTSVDATVPASLLTVSGVPITTSGTIAIGLATQSANLVLAGPSSGVATAPTFRSIVDNDLPVVSVVKGGTGLSSYAVGDILYANSGTSLARLADIATGNALLSGGVGVAPSWGKVDVTTTITGTLPIANGGTGQTTAETAFNALAPTTTRGDLIFRDATTNTRLAASTSGYLLQTNGAGTDPTWSGFLQAGTGATTRTWQAKARDIFSVKDFGATGDGSTDDTTAVQAAITAAGTAGGGEVLLPRGTYVISQVTLPNEVNLVGEGVDATFIKLKDTTNGSMIVSSTWLANQAFVNLYNKIRGITFDGNKTNNLSGGTALVVRSFQTFVTDCNFINWRGDALVQSSVTANGSNGASAAECVYERCRFSANESRHFYGYDNSTSFLADGWIVDCFFGTGGAAGIYQIEIQRAAGWHIRGCQIYNDFAGNMKLSACARTLIEECHFDLSATQQSAATTYTSLDIGNCIESGVQINGCVFYNNLTDVASSTFNSINFSSTTSRALLSGNTFYQSGHTLPVAINRSAVSAATGLCPPSNFFVGYTYAQLGQGYTDIAGAPLADGTAAIPSLSFLSDSDTGLYLAAANTMGFAVGGAGEVQLSSTALSPVTSDGNALGTTSNMWSDLFLASGSVINWNNGDVTLTHSSNLLSGAGGQFLWTYGSGAVTAPARFVNDVDAAFVTGLTVEGDRATPANNDTVVQSFFLSNASGTQKEAFRMSARITNVTAGAETSDSFWSVLVAGTTTSIVALSSTTFRPSANDGAALGSTSTSWSDLFLASGGVINWNNGTYTLTQSGTTLTSSGTIATADLTVTNTPRINQAASSIGTGAKTISNAADSSTNFGKYFALNLNGTTVYVPCGTVAPT